jgi:glycosyltransferase involved in cell wall biosynthesis
MRLLIVTQAVDNEDPILGFFLRWIEEFAKRFDEVHVICLKAGTHSLPRNVKVHSLGKESGESRLKYIARFYRYAWTLRNSYDCVFVHMNPEYVLLGGLLWKMLHKKVVLWYLHRSRHWMFQTAVPLVDTVATAAKESLRVSSPKIVAVGHGIDVDSFAWRAQINTQRPRIVTVGRITPIKHIDTMIEAIALLRDSESMPSLDIVGPTIYESDVAYKQTLEAAIDQKGLTSIVRFVGSKTAQEIYALYADYDCAINGAPTGGIDKVVLESSASGVPSFACNETFRQYFEDDADTFMYTFCDAKDLAERIRSCLKREDLDALRRRVKERVASKASLPTIVERLSGLLRS